MEADVAAKEYGYEIGELVTCVNNEGMYSHDSLILGKDYTVHAFHWSNSYRLWFVEVKEHPGVAYSPFRFKEHHDRIRSDNHHSEDELLGSGPHTTEQSHEAAPLSPMGDVVNDPSRYKRFKFEPLRVDVENFGRGILVHKISKYVLRAPHKGKWAEDLKKAARCLEMLTLFDLGDPDWWMAPADYAKAKEEKSRG